MQTRICICQCECKYANANAKCKREFAYANANANANMLMQMHQCKWGRSRSVAANPFKNKQKINKLLAATKRLRQHSETVKPEVEFRGGAVAAP